MVFKLGPDHLNYYICCYISQNNQFTTFRLRSQRLDLVVIEKMPVLSVVHQMIRT